MTKRIVLSVFGAVLLALGALTAITGGALMALFGSSNTVNSGLQQLSTPTAALVSPVTEIQNTTGVQTIFGRVRLRLTATPARAGRQVFLGIGPAAAVDRYLRGVSHDVASDVTVTPFHLTLHHFAGASAAAPPRAQHFWVAEASGNHATLSWAVTDGSYRVVAMNTDGAAPISFNAQLAVSIPRIFTIGTGLLTGGVVLILLAGLLFVLALRSRVRARGGSRNVQVESVPRLAGQAGQFPDEGIQAHDLPAPTSTTDS